MYWTGLFLIFVSSQMTIADDKLNVLCKIETGFKQDGHCRGPAGDVEESITKQMLEIRCGFKLIALSHMRLTKRLLIALVDDDNGSDSGFCPVTGHMPSFSDNGRMMLAILHGVGFDRLYDMWSFYLLVAEIDSYRERMAVGLVGGQGLNDLLDRVANELRKSVDTCTKANRFDIASPECTVHRAYMDIACFDDVAQVIQKYTTEVEGLLRRNQLRVDNSCFHVDRLYLNHVALNEANLTALMTVYDGHLMWGSAKTVLLEAYKQAKGNPENILDGLGPIRKYHQAFKDILKIIMLRILWTHAGLVDLAVANYSKPVFDFGNNGVKGYTRSLNTIMVGPLRAFVEVAGLKDDTDLYDLIGFLSSESNANAKTLAALLTERLKRVSSSFTDAHILNDPVDFDGLNGPLYLELLEIDEDNERPSVCPGELQRIPLSINYNCVRTMIFVNHVRRLLKHVDFDLITKLFSSAHSLRTALVTDNL